MLKRIGVLALQGDFAEHAAALQRLGTETIEVRLPGHLETVEGLIIPGGESTSLAHLMDTCHLRKPLIERIREGLPTLGTCAGMIMLAQSITKNPPTPLGLLNICVTRNAFGRQMDSFEEDIAVPALGQRSFRAVFIRAPVVQEMGQDVRVMARLQDGRVVAVRQGNILATAFHPELTPDTRFHNYFLDMPSETSTE